MTGANIQLSRRGKQDKYLNINPEMSLFKASYKRHDGFAIETKKHSFNNVGFGINSQCNLLRDPDFIGRINLHISLPSLNIKNLLKTECRKDIDIKCMCMSCLGNKNEGIFGWVNSIGHMMIEDYSFSVGTKQLDKKTGEWLEWLSEFSQTTEKQNGYWEMIGKRDPRTFTPKVFSDCEELLVPLDFFFTTNSSTFFPLCAIDEDSITINIKWRNFNECWISTDPTINPQITPNFKATLLVDYIYVDHDVRRKFQTQDHLYTIHQVQENPKQTYNKSSKDILYDLHFSQPVKSIYWAIQRDDIMQKSLSKEHDFTYGNDLFNYSCYKSRYKNNPIKDTFNEASIISDGGELFEPLPAKFFRLSQSYFNHTKTPSNYLYMRSFAMSLEDIQPTGTLNFSMFKTIKLKIKMNNHYPTNFTLKAYALSYNWIIIKDKKVSLAFNI